MTILLVWWGKAVTLMAEMQVLRLRPPVGLVDFAQDDNFVGGGGQKRSAVTQMAEMQVLRLRPPVGQVDFAQDDNFFGVAGKNGGR